MRGLSKAIQEAELFLASYDAAMEDPEQNHTLVAQQDAMPLAESLRSVLAALSSPPADDVREALAFRLFAHESGQDEDFVRRIWASHPVEHPVKLLYLGQADALLSDDAFEVRPYGTVTDAEVEIAWRTYEGIEPDEQLMGHGIGVARSRMRAALEAAREARS